MLTLLRRSVRGLVALGLVALTACGGGNDETGQGTLSGQVVASADSAPVAGATVSVGALSTRTAADGSYTLAEVPAAAHAVVRVSSSGFVDGLVTTPVKAGATVQVGARLLTQSAVQTFDAGSAAVLRPLGSPAQVALPASSLVVAATGAAASGTLSAWVTPINPALDPQTMPGDYSVSDTARIESFGALQVTLKDAAGNALQLKSGSQATIRIPLASRTASPPTSIPLYWFNETTGRWVQEGSATLAGTAPEQYYEGQVSHFSYWNADMPQETIYVNGCVVDTNGQRLAYAVAHSSGIDYIGTAVDVSDEEGRFRVAIRKGGRASIWAERDGISPTVAVGPSQVDITLPNCLVISTAPMAPTIVQQPADAEAPQGGLAWFSVVVSGSRPLSYQWQHDGVNIAGATYEGLELTSVGTGDAGQYTVIVRNAAGTVTSLPARLTVAAPVAPSIVVPPQATSVSVGDIAMFSVAAAGTPTLTYQWLRNGEAIAGATGSGYATPATTMADNGASYAVRVSNAQGNVLSPAALLTVTAPVLAAPTIQVQPADASGDVGNAVSFAVAASGTPAPSYQWRRNGTAIPGATSASYTTPTLLATDHGALYSVVVSNSQGSVTSRDALLSVSTSTAEDKLQLVRLMGLSFDFYEAASLPLAFTDDTGAVFISPATVCSSGSITGRLNGGALPAPGTAVPTAATLAATASACDIGGVVFTGSSSVAYSLSNLDPTVGSATGTVSSVRLREASGDNVTRDLTANGVGNVTFTGSVSGGQTTNAATLALTSGASLRNELSGLTATFASGSVAMRTVEATSTGVLQSTRLTYNELRFTVAGVNHLATGSYEVRFTAQGGYAGGSGEAVLSADGVRVGRIYANSEGIFIEVDGISQPFGGAMRSRAL